MEKKLIKPEDMAIKVSLSIPERVNFITILPQKGSLSGIALKRALAERVRISKEEATECELVFLTNSRFSHNPSKAKLREYRFETFEILYIQQSVRFLDENELLEDFNADMAAKFLTIAIKNGEK